MLSRCQMVLVSGEVCWLAYIVQDILSVWTKGYTRKYASPSSILMWAAVTVTQFVSPVHVLITLDPLCKTNEIDLEFICNLGVISTGSRARLGFQVALNVACLALCLGWVVYKRKKVVLPKSLYSSEPTFLYSMAAHLFRYEPWMLDARGIVYLDQASALLNGLVTYNTTEAVYMLGVKTWRTLKILKPRDIEPWLSSCVPLTGDWE
ncbi:hypothetical protein AeRB84_018015 [Aphanomyces euteiches]|nr:hypothetical protein AeRB84_018015 [Aphanomyces euteiches]